MNVPDEWLTLSGFHRLWHESEAFRAFALKAYAYLCTMPVGRGCTFERYEGERLEWCIRTAAAFLLEGDNWRYYELSDDRLTVWHKHKEPPLILQKKSAKSDPTAVTRTKRPHALRPSSPCKPTKRTLYRP
jgi:hypothetical protein